VHDVTQMTLTQSYGPVFMIVAFSLFVAIMMFTLASLLGPKNPTPEKAEPYECGSPSTGGQHLKMSVKFYLTAILFVVFDIEAIFLYPWAVLFQRLGVVGFIEMFLFLSVLTVTLVYCWKKGALEWQA
jgi:NADH-quinone oxidoreductase subunit A